MVKLLKTTKNKIILCRSLMKKLNLNYFDIDNKLFNKKDPFEFDNAEWQTLEKTFRLHRKKPDNKHDLFKLIVILIRNITCNDLIVIDYNKQKKKMNVF